MLLCNMKWRIIHMTQRCSFQSWSKCPDTWKEMLVPKSRKQNPTYLIRAYNEFKIQQVIWIRKFCSARVWQAQFVDVYTATSSKWVYVLQKSNLILKLTKDRRTVQTVTSHEIKQQYWKYWHYFNALNVIDFTFRDCALILFKELQYCNKLAS